MVTEQSTFGSARHAVAGEHGRISRVNGLVDTARDEEDAEGCEFWKAQCEDIDCIYEGEHCRYQCAIAELDEEPRSKVPAPKCRLGFRRLALRRQAGKEDAART